MPTFRVSSAGVEALVRLETGGGGRVHSVYDDAFNMVWPKGMVSVVPSSKGRGPINLVLAPGQPLEHPFGELVQGSEVTFEGGLLTMEGKLRMVLRGAEEYRSPLRFNRRPTSDDQIRRNLVDARNQILATGRLDGLGTLLGILNGEIHPREAASPFVAAAIPSVVSLIRELSRGELAGSVEAARGLVGLGVGLTPSGDDLLSGAFLAMILGSENGIGGPPHIREVAAKVALEAIRSTTLLSQNYIDLASRGEGNEVVIRFVEELFTGNSGALSHSLADLLSFGATSGTDIAAGVIIGATAALGDEVEAL